VSGQTVTTRLRSAGVPRRFEECRLDGFQRRQGTTKALEAAGMLADDLEGRGLVLTGPPGCGKTHLAVGILARRVEAWLNEWPEQYREVLRHPAEAAWGGETAVATRPNLALRFVVVPTLLDRLRAAARYQEPEDPLPALYEADLVVLDDLGREKATDWAHERLYVLVNERYNRVLPTIATSNLTVGELVDRGHDALISRLLEGADAVQIAAGDYRIRRGS